MKITVLLVPFVFCSTLLAQQVPHHAFHQHRVAHDDRAEHRSHPAENITFEPMMAWTYQHASKVLPGSPSTRAVLYYNIGGAWTLWNETEGLGQIVYGIQGNVAGGTSVFPSLANSVGNPMAMNNILTSEKLELSSLYWQQTLSDHKTRIRVGKMLDSGFFDKNAIAADPVSGFMAQNFNQSMTNPMPGYGFGLNIEWEVEQDKLLRIGIANSEPKGVRTTGIGGMTWNHLFSIVELDITSMKTIQGVARKGQYRFIVWRNGIKNDSDTGDIDGWGVMFNCDQKIADDTTVFARIGVGDKEVTTSKFSVSSGFELNQPLGFSNTTTGLAYQFAEMSDSDTQQHFIEWYARTQLENGMYVGPVVQYFDDDTISGSVILGFRTSLAF